MHKKRGFTLIELVTVLVIIGIISAVALPRFFSADSFYNRGFYTEVVNAMRFSQQLAVAINCNTRVVLTSNSYTVTLDDDSTNCSAMSFGTPARNPITGELGFSGNSTNASISTPTTVTFNALGSATSDTTITVGNISFCVNSSSGYISEGGTC